MLGAHDSVLDKQLLVTPLSFCKNYQNYVSSKTVLRQEAYVCSGNCSPLNFSNKSFLPFEIFLGLK